MGWIEDNIAACYSLALCYKALGHNEKSFHSLLRSFEYNSPRAEITCEIEYYFMNKNDYPKAIDWFLLSTHLEKPSSLGFLLNDYWNFIPYIELSVCYYKLGNIEKAVLYNEVASKYKPNSDAVLYNKKFFVSLK